MDGGEGEEEGALDLGVAADVEDAGDDGALRLTSCACGELLVPMSTE